jgi:uncharacterized protein (TIGR02145 family)
MGLKESNIQSVAWRIKTMKNLFTKIALIAGIGLAITFTLSCSGDPDDNSGGGGQSHPGPSVTYGDETYQTVVIGTQTWMARNLDYNVEGSKCYGDDTANCSKYGRLYDWATAMALPNCGYGTSCASQIGAKHRGICPSGWHIPSDVEWTTLTDFVGGSSTAGKKLKATSGWNEGGNGTDSYGFAALPGGAGDSGGNFNLVGESGYWLSATEYRVAYYAYRRNMDYDEENVFHIYLSKGYLHSVRCLQD